MVWSDSEAEELTLDQYNRGLSTIFELLDAQSRRLNSESLLINAKRLRLTNRIKMYMAIATPVYGNDEEWKKLSNMF